MPEEEKKEEKLPPLEAIKIDELSAIRTDAGTVIGIPEDFDAVLVTKKPAMFGLGWEVEVKPLLPIEPKELAEIEKKERETPEKVITQTVEIPKTKVVEVPKYIEVPKPEKILVKEEQLTPEELKKQKPEEFEEEEIPPERRVEFREQLGKVIEGIKEKAVPKIKAGIKKLTEIGKTSWERLRGWLKKIGICTPEVEKAIEELIAEEKGRIPEKEVLASKEKTLSEEVL
jgi:hypothetical protein